MKLLRNKKGFTLVEMILYVAICSLFLLTLSTFMTFLLGARIRSQSIAEVNQQGFQVMHLMTSTLRNGRSVETPPIGNSSSTLSVTTGVGIYDPTIFQVSSGTLFVQEGPNTPIALTNSRVSIGGVLFENVSSSSSLEKIIRITFTVDSKNIGGRSEYTYTKTFTGSATLRQ